MMVYESWEFRKSIFAEIGNWVTMVLVALCYENGGSEFLKMIL